MTKTVKAQIAAIDLIGDRIANYNQAVFNLHQAIENESAEFLALCKDDWSWEIPDSPTSMNPRRELIHEILEAYRKAVTTLGVWTNV